MELDDPLRWDDGRVIGLVVELLGGEQARGGGLSTAGAHARSPAGLSLADVVAGGRAAYCWLDAVVTVRNVTRHREPVAGASPHPGPAANLAAPQPDRRTIEGR